jgi:hypothetical protein
MLKVSWLHRVFRFKPGRVPRWVCSASSCEGLDLFSVVGSVIFLLALSLFRTRTLLATGLVILLVLYAYPMTRFYNCERLARARRRRNECVFCGRALEKQSSENLQVCGRCPDTANTPQPQSGTPLGGACRGKMVD